MATLSDGYGTEVPRPGPDAYRPKEGLSLDPKPAPGPTDNVVPPNSPEDPNLPTLWWSNDESRLLAVITAMGSVGMLALIGPWFQGAAHLPVLSVVIAVICGLINAVCLWRLNQLAVESSAAPPPDTGQMAILGPLRRRRRVVNPALGPWATYTVVISLLIADVAATGSLVFVLGTRLAPGTNVDGKLLATAFMGFLLSIRLIGMKVSRNPVVIGFGVVGAAFAFVIFALFRMPSAPIPHDALSVASVFEPGGLLVVAFALQLRVGATLWRPDDETRPMRFKLTAPINILVIGVGYCLLVWQLGNVMGRPDADAPRLLKAAALADSSGVVLIIALVVLVSMAVGTALAWMDDAVHLAGVLCRSNGLPDIFTPRRDTSVQPLGEVVVVALMIFALIIASAPGQLVAMAVFGTLLGFLLLNVTAASASAGGLRWLLGTGAALCLIYLLALSPDAVLSGGTVFTVALVLRSIYIVWTEPTSPVLVEGLIAPRQRGEDDEKAGLLHMTAVEPGRAPGRTVLAGAATGVTDPALRAVPLVHLPAGGAAGPAAPTPSPRSPSSPAQSPSTPAPPTPTPRPSWAQHQPSTPDDDGTDGGRDDRTPV